MSWIKYARPGDEIIFVDDRPNCRVTVSRFFNFFKRAQIARHNLVKGEKYKITGFEVIKDVYEVEHVLIWIEGFRLRAFNYALPFPPIWFRPIQRRETDISIFTDMLKQAPADVREEA